MFIKYNPEEDELVYCKCCGVVLNKQTIKEYDSQHTYIECPVCALKGDIEEK